MRPLITYLLAALLPCSPAAVAQPSAGPPAGDAVASSPGVVRSIRITGNRRTKPYIVERELPFTIGASYTVAEIFSNIRTARQNLMNTALFVDVSVTPCNWSGDTLDIQVDVKERWYIWPFVFFRPVDRNWNVWINQHDISLDRINYGLATRFENISGRNDKLTATYMTGYTRKVSLNYFNPFSDPRLRHGFGMEFSYARYREVNYTTRANLQRFYKDDSRFMREELYAGISYSYRKGSINRHTAELGFRVDRVDDTILQLNPGYFKDPVSRVAYPELQYRFQHLDVDYIPYPTRGHILDVEFLKRGFGGAMDLWQLTLRAGNYWTLPKRNYLGVQGEFGLKLPFDQPFVNQPFLGYGDSYLRGLEYYVIDGVAGGFVRSTYRKEFARADLRTGLRSRIYNVIPFRFFLKGYVDAGYVYNRNNTTGNLLTNRFLYTGGVGVDVLTIYDWVLRFEFSFNQLREQAFFFHKNGY